MIRATTGGVMRTYRSNLMNSFINMNANRNTVLTQRIFNSFAEDPAAAAKAFRLRKSRMTVESQYAICTDAIGKYQQAVSCLQSNDDILCTKGGEYGYYMKTLTGTTLSMLNDPTGDAREQLSKALDQMSQQVIQTMNQKYGDDFIFAGADGHNVPFEIRQVDGKDRLFYRGVPVDAVIPNVLTEKNADGTESFIAVNAKGQIIEDPETYPEQVYYLRMESYNVQTISEKEYEDLYEMPVRQTFDALAGSTVDQTTKYAFNSIGELIPVKEEVNDDGETVYSFDYESVGKEPHPNDGFITLSEDNIYYKVTGTDPELLVSIGDDVSIDNIANPSDTVFVEYDENGIIRSGGGYYQRIYNTDQSTKLISEQEYKDALERANGELPFRLTDKDGNVVPVNEDGTTGGDGGFYRIIDMSQLITPADYGEQKLIADKLNYLAHETQFVDIGFGFQEDPVTGKLIETSAFNIALNGINFLGYGLDEDGDPRNIYSLVQRMKEIAESVTSGTDWDTETYDKFYGLVQKFEDAVSNYQTEFVNLDASTSKLTGQQELLVDNFDTLQEQYSDIEDVDMVDAITSFIWAEYCYNAALKVGNSILSESLMDYLR